MLETSDRVRYLIALAIKLGQVVTARATAFATTCNASTQIYPKISTRCLVMNSYKVTSARVHFYSPLATWNYGLKNIFDTEHFLKRVRGLFIINRCPPTQPDRCEASRYLADKCSITSSKHQLRRVTATRFMELRAQEHFSGQSLLQGRQNGQRSALLRDKIPILTRLFDRAKKLIARSRQTSFAIIL